MADVFASVPIDILSVPAPSDLKPIATAFPAIALELTPKAIVLMADVFASVPIDILSVPAPSELKPIATAFLAID